MKLPSKFDEVLKKPREGRIFRTSNFILYDPKAFKLIFMWGLWLAVLNFGIWSVVLTLNKADIIFTGVLWFFFFFSAHNLVKFYKLRKIWGEAFKTMTISQFMRFKK